MRIVSQRRNYSFDFDRTIFWRQYEGIYAKADNADVLIGKYASEKRAAEVFEDIHKAYAPVYSISDNLTWEQVYEMLIPSKNIVANNIVDSGQDFSLTAFDNYVYYMPEE